MTSDVTGRRLRRRAAQRLFDELAVDYLNLPGVSRPPMFGSDGLRVDARFFAFVGRDGQLIVKLPAAKDEGLVAAGEADPVRAGRATIVYRDAEPPSERSFGRLVVCDPSGCCSGW